MLRMENWDIKFGVVWWLKGMGNVRKGDLKKVKKRGEDSAVMDLGKAFIRKRFGPEKACST